MSLSYDQKSEIRMAFDEAFIPTERRRDLRIRHRVDAQICGWKDSRQGHPIGVRIEDFSPGGVGLTHHTPMPVGAEYLIKIPRPERNELVVLIGVVRCVPAGQGGYHIGMELRSVMDRTSMGELVDAINVQRRITSRRTKLLLILFGIVGIGTALFIP